MKITSKNIKLIRKNYEDWGLYIYPCKTIIKKKKIKKKKKKN